MDVRGTVAAGWEPVRDAFLRNFEQRGERGAAVAVHHDGAKVVDLWAGTKDADGTAPWTEDTAQVVRSATKGVAAAVPLLLHQRGRIDLDAPVATYWPAFKAAGKDRVTVRRLLAHQAGVPVLDRPLTLAEATDLEASTAAIAAQAPAWEPGTGHGYHAHTFSWLLSGLVHHVTGRTIGRWVADELAAPLGLDLWIGLPAAEEHRVGRLAPVEAPEEAGALRLRPKRSVTEAWEDPDSLTRRAFEVISPRPDENDPAYRAAELPGSAGVATARALSRFYAATLGPRPGLTVPVGFAGKGERDGAMRLEFDASEDPRPALRRLDEALRRHAGVRYSPDPALTAYLDGS